MKIDTVIFDIGGVLIDWQPHLAWADEMGDEGARAFLDRIGFDKLNFACDGGARFEQAAERLACAQDAKHLNQYVARYAKTVPQKIESSWHVLEELKQAGTPVHAITNWSAETWPEGLKAHPKLGDAFDETVVSGEVGVVKPSVEIYRLLCSRADVDPQQCVFIDDGYHNCLGAMAAGMDAIHFTGADSLRRALAERGIL